MQHLSSVKTTLNSTARRHFWESFPAKMTAKLAWLLPSLISVSLLCHVAKAASLASWNFDTNQNQLDLRTDEEVRPKVQLIFNPTRLVVDLPGVTLKRTQTVHKRISSVIREVRVGQVDSQTTRLVIELAPGYTLDPNQIQVHGDSPTHWRVKLPTQIQLSSDNSFVPLPQTSDKLPILVALFQDIDAGKISLDEILVMRRDLITGGSDTMQYQKPGTRYRLSRK